MTGQRLLDRPSRLSALLLALLAYVPSLAAKPGRMPSDTKLYLYLNPGRLIRDAPFTWDTSQFGGWVPHQTIAYLWPSGPWFWFFDRLGVPDWVAHRLWIGTLLLIAGLGVRWAARCLGLTAAGALSAAVVYQLSPYVLAYISRTSVMLLPWAAVGWITGLTIRAATRGGWRYPAIIALVVLTVGAVNATALALIAPAPILWLVHAAWARSITWRDSFGAAWRIAVTCLSVSLWWMAMLVVQGAHGADVLSYSESLRDVSSTSTGVETLRGLGYWLFYVRDPYAFTTTASADYMTSGRLIVIGFCLLLLCMAGLVFTRWSQRRYAAMLVFVGIVLAVGVHPIDDPSPLMSPVANSGLSLALRSSTRALPLSTFGLALGAGALVTAMAATRFRVRMMAPAAVIGLAVLNLPALWTGGFVDEALTRDQDPPAAWTQAARQLDTTSSEYRVMQLPGAEFGAFRWGYTVDPPLPGITDKPVITRDLLPLGAPGVMDLLYALDDRFQDGTIDPAAIAPVARLLGVDTIWVANDMAFDRFRTPRPEWMSALYAARPAGLGEPVRYGPPAPNTPDIAVVDERALSTQNLGAPVAPVELVAVDDAVAIVRAADRVIVLAGSGDGVVDAAAAGLLAGDEAVLYANDATPDDLAAAVMAVLTDSNRDRAHHWRSSQDVWGFTETGGSASDELSLNSGDQRLAVFPDEAADQQTVALLDGGHTVRASAYGEPFAYRPEDRAAMAVDGDPATAWRVGDRANPIGQFIEVSDVGDGLTLLQPQLVGANRMITSVRVESLGGTSSPITIALDGSSLVVPGQRIATPSGPLRLVITGVGERSGGTDTGPSAVGFAEVGVGPWTEFVRLPIDPTAGSPDTPLSVVLTRLRIDPQNRWRSDPEPVMNREFTLQAARTFDTAITLRLNARASDLTIAALTGAHGAMSDRRLVGTLTAAGRLATDADRSTAWTAPFTDVVGSTLTIAVNDQPMHQLTLQQIDDANHSLITEVAFTMVDGGRAIAPVPPPDEFGTSTVTVPTDADRKDGRLAMTVTAISARTTIDRRFAEATTLPVSIVEVEGVAVTRSGRSATRDASTCRDDLVTLDGVAWPIAVDSDDIDAMAAGQAVSVAPCGSSRLEIDAGTHRIATTTGITTGIDVDQVVLRAPQTTPASAAPSVTVERSRTNRIATVAPCPSGCWLILGEGYNPQWSASTTTRQLGEPRQIAGGFNGWWLEPSTEPTVVTMSWQAQRSVTLALVASLVGVLMCLGLAWRSRPGHALFRIAPPRFVELPGAPVTRRELLPVGATLVIASALAVSPGAALLAAAIAALMIITHRRETVGLTAVLLVVIVGARVVRRVVVARPAANGGWPGAFSNLHELALLAVVCMLAGAIVVDRDTGHPPATATSTSHGPAN